MGPSSPIVSGYLPIPFLEGGMDWGHCLRLGYCDLHKLNFGPQPRCLFQRLYIRFLGIHLEQFPCLSFPAFLGPLVTHFVSCPGQREGIQIRYLVLYGNWWPKPLSLRSVTVFSSLPKLTLPSVVLEGQKPHLLLVRVFHFLNLSKWVWPLFTGVLQRVVNSKN